jgi:uncharacterized protein YecE (DUF72 family)
MQHVRCGSLLLALSVTAGTVAGVALCIAESDELATPMVETAAFGYLRLRRARYTSGALSEWAERLRDRSWRDAYVFFRHDEEGQAPRDAAALRERLG